MRLNDVELRVLVKGRAITEYPHNGETFVEGRAGSPYEIEIANHSPGRIEVILSVDGLGVRDGKEAGLHSPSYLVEGFGRITVPGWTLDMGSVAGFEFSSPKASYAKAATGSTNNVGVIGVMAFNEKVSSISRDFLYSTNWGTQPLGHPVWDVGATTYDAMPTSTGRATATSSVQSVNTSAIGTGFGQRTDFAVKEVSFTRGELIGTLIMRYDDAKGLKRRGIAISKPSRAHLNVTPQAFPGLIGCIPPKGWKG